MYSIALSNVWKMNHEKKGNCKTHAIKAQAYFGSLQRYQDFRHLLQNPTVPYYVMHFSNHAQGFTGSNNLDVDSPFNCEQCQWSFRSFE